MGGTVLKARRTILMLWTLLGQLMGMTESNEENVGTTEQLIRVFLTCCADLDKEMRPAVKKRKKPF